MRGKDLLPDSPFQIDGIIPAHAGKSLGRCSVFCFFWDHPRSCGEKWLFSLLAGGNLGSSPLMRGKGPVPSVNGLIVGIIPAHAGKSQVRTYAPAAAEDHPRSCGEKCPGTTIAVLFIGSSPLMRGKACFPAMCLDSCRIIPAHAGKRHGPVKGGPAARDHPRSCGEKHAVRYHRWHGAGSSPLMRGKAAGCRTG